MPWNVLQQILAACEGFLIKIEIGDKTIDRTDCLTPKEKRIIELEVATRCSKEAFRVLNTIEEWNAFGFFHPSVRTDTNTLPLLDVGIRISVTAGKKNEWEVASTREGRNL